MADFKLYVNVVKLSPFSGLSSFLSFRPGFALRYCWRPIEAQLNDLKLYICILAPMSLS